VQHQTTAHWKKQNNTLQARAKGAAMQRKNSSTKNRKNKKKEEEETNKKRKRRRKNRADLTRSATNKCPVSCKRETSSSPGN
jgi:hypothetical protein